MSGCAKGKMTPSLPLKGKVGGGSSSRLKDGRWIRMHVGLMRDPRKIIFGAQDVN